MAARGSPWHRSGVSVGSSDSEGPGLYCMVVSTVALVFFSPGQFFSVVLGIVPGNNLGPLSPALPKVSVSFNKLLFCLTLLEWGLLFITKNCD